MTNEQLTQEVMNLKEHQAKAEAEHDKFQIILSEVQEAVKENKELIIAVKEITTEMKYVREEQTDMNKRLKIIEEKPSQNWNKIVTTTIGTIVGAIAGGIIGLIIK